MYRKSDVGKPKAEVAAAFINKRVPGVKVTPYPEKFFSMIELIAFFLTLSSFFGKIQDKDDDYYRQFQIIIAGLDSIDARRWINGLLVNMVDEDEEGNPDPDSIIPFIDGGTEG